MAATVRTLTENSIEVTFTLNLGGSMLKIEENLLNALNQAGSVAMAEAISRFDADGTPLKMGNLKFTSKGKHGQTYETPYGPVAVRRHVYQSSKGGKTFCPLERDTRMVMNATPRYAKIISGKYARMGADVLRRDLLEANGREISRDYVKKLGDFIGGIAQAKEENWEYPLPEFDRPVASVGVGIDGTCLLTRDDQWRLAMCGSITLYDKTGERLHTIYAGASPEYGKETFYQRFDRELARVKARFPEALYIGVADGAPDNWTYLKPRTNRQVVDFYHAREYVGKAAVAIYDCGPKKISWEDDWSHRLKHDKGAAKRLLNELEAALPTLRRKTDREDLGKAITYFSNHYGQMQYWRNTVENLPIGSGVTEAACKTLIKQRLVCSGMRWNDQGASAVIALRSLEITEGRWDKFWRHISQYGVN